MIPRELDRGSAGAIYGLEEADGVRALVLELGDGPPPADRIAAGALGVDEALPIARRIAEALEAAHEKGVMQTISARSARKAMNIGPVVRPWNEAETASAYSLKT